MWKLKHLEKIPMYYNPGWPDLPILLGASLLGEFLYVPKANFYYLEIKKTEAYRAYYQDNINYKNNKYFFIYFKISKITKFLIVAMKIGYKLEKIRGALLMIFFALKKLFSNLTIIFRKKFRST